MKIESYPPQEPLSEIGQRYHMRVMELGKGIVGTEHQYGGDPYQSLTVFNAERPSGDVLLFFHGGGWTSGYKEWMHFMAPAICARGITFVSGGYRLAPRHVFPACFDDVADVVAWTVKNIHAYGGDPSRIFVGGHSAGGHLAALLAVQQDWVRARKLASNTVRGCLPVSGVYRFGDGSGLTQRPRFLGTTDGVEVTASPASGAATNGVPSFLIAYGEHDFPHLIDQANDMVERLTMAGTPVDRLVLPDCDHFEASVACAGTWSNAAVEWMLRSRT